VSRVTVDGATFLGTATAASPRRVKVRAGPFARERSGASVEPSGRSAGSAR